MNSQDSFDCDGFRLFSAALGVEQIDRVASLWHSQSGPGRRLDLHGLAPIGDLIADLGVLGTIAKRCLGRNGFVVRAILFDKRAEANWSLGWHQDRTIMVARKYDVPGFGPWTVKQRLLHVQPPQSVIDAMVTLRVHIDDVPADNGPLRVVSGSHRLGRVMENSIDEIADKGPIFDCLAFAGDVWAYRTAILHASLPSNHAHARRRVLQLDFAASELPSPLKWAMGDGSRFAGQAH